MKKLLLTLIGFIPMLLFSKGADTIVTNLNLKYSTIKAFAVFAKQSPDEKTFKAFLKFRTTVRSGNEPVDNANVNIDTIYTLSLVQLYEFLVLNCYLKDEADEMKQSTNSKRNTNAYLDALFTEIESRYIIPRNQIKIKGRLVLLGL